MGFSARSSCLWITAPPLISWVTLSYWLSLSELWSPHLKTLVLMIQGVAFHYPELPLQHDFHQPVGTLWVTRLHYRKIPTTETKMLTSAPQALSPTMWAGNADTFSSSPCVTIQAVTPLFVASRLWFTLPLSSSLHKEIIIIPASQLILCTPINAGSSNSLEGCAVRASLSNQRGPTRTTLVHSLPSSLALPLPNGSLFCFSTAQSWESSPWRSHPVPFIEGSSPRNFHSQHRMG